VSRQCHAEGDPLSSGRSGIVFTCDSEGLVLKEIVNDFAPSLQLFSGQPPFAGLDETAQESYAQFIHELCLTGDVFGWELASSIGATPVTLLLYGISHDDFLTVVCSTSQQHLIRMLDEYLTAKNELVNTVESLYEEQAAAQADPENLSMVEMLQLNNSLVTLQRQMAQRNKELSRRERFIRSVIAASPNLVYVYDLRSKRITFTNEAFSTVLGIEQSEVLAMRDPVSSLRLAPEPLELGSPILDGLIRPTRNAAVVEWSSHIPRGGRDGTWLLSRATTFEANEAGDPETIMVISTDVTELRLTQNRLRKLVTHDQMTPLLNRRGLFGQSAQLMAALKRSASPITVMMIDLDDLKGINDSFGHNGGDLAITDMATILMASTREADVTARVGGDEFVIFAPDTDGQGAVILARRIRSAITKHNESMPAYGKLSASIGWSTTAGPDDYNFQHLLSIADAHMYAEKDQKRSSSRLPGI